jgi:chromosome segregation ATPase
MSSAYDQQIKKLVDHIQSLNQSLHERNMQIVQWQQVARAVQDERARIARALLDQVRLALGSFATRYKGLREENTKLRVYVDHQKQLHEVVARDLQGQLKYGLSRIDELAQERGEWRSEVNVTRQAALKYQQQVQEQKGVINSQQGALTELKGQLEQAMRFADQEERFKAEMAHLEREMETVRTQLGNQDQTLVVKDRELRRLNETFEAFKLRANEEVQALAVQLRDAQSATSGVDERVEEMTSLLGNSEREVAKLFKELQEERNFRKEAEIRLDAISKSEKTARSKANKLEKEMAQAKGQKLSDIQKELDRMVALNAQMQEKLDAAEADKTHYMQAVEGQKPKLRPLPPVIDQSSS